MQEIRSFLLDVEGHFYNALFSTAAQISNQNSVNQNNTRLSDSLEDVFQALQQEKSYSSELFSSYPYQVFCNTACGLSLQEFSDFDQKNAISIQQLTALYDRGTLFPVEYWSIVGLLYYFAVKQRTNAESILSQIQKGVKISDAIHKAFCDVVIQSNSQFSLEGQNLFIDDEFCTNLENLLIQLLGKSFSSIKTLDGLEAVSYQHPADSAVLQKLNAIPGVGVACEKVVNVVKRVMETSLLANCQRVTPDSHPRLYKLFWTATQILDLKTLPELYIDRSINALNACTNGSDEKAFIVLSDKIVYQFDERELLYVIGHEMGHIQCGHVKYGVLASVLCHSVASIPLLGSLIQGIASISVEPLLALWSRYREFTCDRAGLLCCQNREAALRSCIKLAGQPWDMYKSIRTRTFVDQTLLFEKSTQGINLDKVFSIYNVLYADHPFTIYRATELLKWIASGAYEEIVKNDVQGRQALKERQKLDPALIKLFDIVEEILVDWHLEKYPELQFKTTRQSIRRLLYENRPADAFPLSDLFEIALIITEKGVDSYGYQLEFKTFYNNQPIANMVELNVPDTSRDAVPADFRKEFLRSGSEVVRMSLYKVQ